MGFFGFQIILIVGLWSRDSIGPHYREDRKRRYSHKETGSGITDKTHEGMGVKPAELDGVIPHEQDRIVMTFANQTALDMELVNLARGSPDT